VTASQGKECAALALEELDRRRNESIIAQCMWAAGLIRGDVMPSVITLDDAIVFEVCAVTNNTIQGKELLQSLRHKLETIINS
jgi:hypothetical protein